MLTIQDIARVCHEANRAYCLCIGDGSQFTWDKAPEWQRSSAVNGVQFIIDNPTSTARASHDSWLKEKREQGWKFGMVKDPAKKEHPCFLPYQELPVVQQAKDFIFAAIARTMLDILEQEELHAPDIQGEDR